MSAGLLSVSEAPARLVLGGKPHGAPKATASSQAGLLETPENTEWSQALIFPQKRKKGWTGRDETAARCGTEKQLDARAIITGSSLAPPA